VEAPGSRTFVMLDAPDLLAREIRRTVEAAPSRPAPKPDYLTRSEGRLTLDISPTPKDE
jgi:hypothetical protein